MESQIAAADQQLIPGLSYSLPSAAEYVVSRRMATFFPEGGNQYSPTGVRVIRFTLADSSVWLDPSTVQLSMTMTNNSTTTGLTFKSPSPLTVFSRCRILVGGTLVEDWQYYCRTVDMLSQLNEKFFRLATEVRSGFGTAADQNPDAESSAIAASGLRKVTSGIVAGLFMQHLYMPLKCAPITIELEFVPNPTSVVANASSQQFTLSDVRLLADVVQLDGQMEDKV